MRTRKTNTNLIRRPQGEPYLIVYTSGKTQWVIQFGNTRYGYLKYLATNAGFKVKNKFCLLKPKYDFSAPPTLDDIEIITKAENEKRILIAGQPTEVQKLIRSLLPLTIR